MSSEREDTKIFLVGLPLYLTKETLTKILQSKFNSKEISVNMKTNFKTGKNYSWGVLHIKDENVYNSVLNEKSFFLRGKKVFIKKYLQGKDLVNARERLNNRKIFVKGISKDATNLEFFNFFQDYAQLEDAFIIKNSAKTKKSTSLLYGFLVLKNENDVEKIIKMQNIEFFGYKLKLKKFRSKEEKAKEISGGKKSRNFHHSTKNLNTKNPLFDKKAVTQNKSKQDCLLKKIEWKRGSNKFKFYRSGFNRGIENEYHQFPVLSRTCNGPIVGNFENENYQKNNFYLGGSGKRRYIPEINFNNKDRDPVIEKIRKTSERVFEEYNYGLNLRLNQE